MMIMIMMIMMMIMMIIILIMIIIVIIAIMDKPKKDNTFVVKVCVGMNVGSAARVARQYVHVGRGR